MPGAVLEPLDVLLSQAAFTSGISLKRKAGEEHEDASPAAKAYKPAIAKLETPAAVVTGATAAPTSPLSRGTTTSTATAAVSASVSGSSPVGVHGISVNGKFGSGNPDSPMGTTAGTGTNGNHTGNGSGGDGGSSMVLTPAQLDRIEQNRQAALARRAAYLASQAAAASTSGGGHVSSPPPVARP